MEKYLGKHRAYNLASGNALEAVTNRHHVFRRADSMYGYCCFSTSKKSKDRQILTVQGTTYVDAQAFPLGLGKPSPTNS